MDLSGKAESLADKMNKLTAKFDLAEELILDGDDIIDFVDEKTKKVDLYESETENNSQELITSSDLINLNIMVEDFKYITSGYSSLKLHENLLAGYNESLYAAIFTQKKK